jgi:hypothetical protein
MLDAIEIKKNLTLVNLIEIFNLKDEIFNYYFH